jgi:NADH:ubiquinone oxidoreductase subunit 6 (subunit J)
MLVALLVAAALALAILAISARKLISSALWLAGVSAALSVVFYLLGAQLIAVIELSIGAGLVTVLFVFVIGIAGDEAIQLRSLVPRPLAWGLVIASVLLLGLMALPLNALPQPSSVPSFVHALWQQRGLDVLVQIVLIFSGVLGMLGLLAEAKAPLKQPLAEQVAAQRDRELLTLQQQTLDKEKQGV